MKNFKSFRENLAESEIVQESGVALPPNILILRRQSIRQFPGTLVALYYNDKLDQHFSIPFGGDEDSLITPTAMKEETLDELNTSTLGSYSRKNVAQLRDGSAPYKRYKGLARATSKLFLRASGPDPKKAQAAKDAINMDEETHTYKVHLNGKHIDTLFYGHHVDPEEVKKSLVNHDGYDSGINVVKKRKQYTPKLEEEILLEIDLGKGDHEVIKAFMNKKPHSSKKLSTDGKRLDGNWLGGSGIAHHSDIGLHMNDLGSRSAQQVHRAIKKHNSLDSHSDVPRHNLIHEGKGFSELRKEQEEIIEEEMDAIAHLRSVKEFHTAKALKHNDDTQTKIDPTTAHALLTVHDALHDDNKKKFADHLVKSKGHFHKMLDFAWKSVSSK